MDICRACMRDSVTLVDIFCDRPLPEYEFSLADMLNDFADFKVRRDDKLPQKICVSCGLNAQIAFRFKRRFQQSHQLLCMKAMESEHVVVDALETISSENPEPMTKTECMQNKISESELRNARKLRKSRVFSCDENYTIRCDDLYTISSGSSTKHPNADDDVIDKKHAPVKATKTLDSYNSHRYPLRQGTRKIPTSVPQRSKLRPFKCDQCRSSFTTIENLRKHQLSHKGERSFQCLHCTKAYRKKSKLQKHIRIHMKDHPFMCIHCSRSFKYSWHLKRHLATHSPERPFVCPHCQLAFKFLNHMDRHLLIHSGKRPYDCTTCGKGFSTKWNLKLHCSLPNKCFVKM